MWVTSNYVNCSRRNPKRSAQCVCHTGMPENSTARAGISWIKKEGQIRSSSIIRWTFFQSLSMFIKKGRPHGHRYGKKPGDRILYGSPIEEEMQKERFPRNPWPLHKRSRIPYSNDWKSSRRRSLSTMGCSCGWRSHSPFDSTRIPPL